MMRLLSSTAIACGIALVGFVGSASATTISATTLDFYNGSNDAPLYSTVAPNSFQPTFVLSVTGSIDGVERSPYQTNSGTAPTDQPYSVLSPGGDSGSSATYNLSGGTNFTILWGSPDDYNFITFYSDANGNGSVLASNSASGTYYTGPDAVCYNSTCNRLTWDLVEFTASDGGIGSVVLSNGGTAAFEYGLAPLSIGPGPTPLPAAVWMFGTVIAGAAGAARLRRRRKA